MRFCPTAALLLAAFVAMVQQTIADDGKEPRSYTFDAARGSLPSEQGFELIDTDGEPAPRVEDGILQQGHTSRRGTQYWRIDDATLDFDAAGGGACVQWELRVEESTTHPGAYYRAGWNVSLKDCRRRIFMVFVAKDRVTLVAGNADSQPAAAEFDAGDRFHRYRLVVDDEAAMLFIDGQQQPLLTKPLGRALPKNDRPGEVYFGNGSQLASSKTQLKSFFYAPNAGAR